MINVRLQATDGQKVNAKAKPVGSLMSTSKEGNEFLLAKSLKSFEKIGREKKKDSPEVHVHEDKELIQEFCDFVNLIVMPT
ncbi:hypothetical protein F2Q69_00032873 [Brassica cretica]|uniref:Uncharacterized protein n=1 Tax=Brassica cretica TaxID=69181 RepID=A0A8S9SSL9_BRACR|nr:hypothetical protein F2Q69_00032873 [Brassica cretica]